ncbi:MAG: molybdate ABC transporter permease subunit [Cyanobacteria bacterium SID2]|nr:molybdate ABC transporter permease subunit [Cyanobacteria bacterium SID2]
MLSNWSPLWISLKVATVATGIALVGGLAAARWTFASRRRGKAFWSVLFLAPMFLPPTVLGLLLLVVLGKNSPLGRVLAASGIEVLFTWIAAVMAASLVAFPLAYKTALGAFEQIDRNLFNAARTLGASEGLIFRRVLLPLALPGIVAGGTLAFARSIGEFGATLMVAGNIPGRTQTIPMAIYFAVEAGEFQEAAFWSLTIAGIAFSGLTALRLWPSRGMAGRSMSKLNSSWKWGVLLGKYLPQTRWPFPRRRSRRFRRAPSPVVLLYDVPHRANPSLTVEIQKQFADFRLDVSFSIDASMLGILGESGAGKSSILRCIAGLETPDCGRIVLNGRVLFDSDRGINLPPRDRGVGFLFQNYALFPHLTVAQNVAFGISPQASRHLSPEIRHQVEMELAAVQLSGYGNRYPHELSGGQQQRVALARAVAGKPDILLLDEPFSALDTHLRQQIERLTVERLERFQGIGLLVTHDLEEAFRACEDLLVLDRGSVAALGAKHEIFKSPKTPSVARLTGCKNVVSAVAVGEREVFVPDWNCTLTCLDAVPESSLQLGIRAHHLMFTRHGDRENTIPCWLAGTSETPHRMTLYLKLHEPAIDRWDYHLQAEVFKAQWLKLKDRSFPWFVRLDSQRLMLLRNRTPHRVARTTFDETFDSQSA